MSNDKESFDSWFNDDDHDLYNFPEEAMREAWDAGRAEQAKRIAELEAVIKDLTSDRNKAWAQAAEVRKAVEGGNMLVIQAAAYK